MENIIGIDFSINFPTLCVWHDGKHDFISFMRAKEIKGRTKKCKDFLSSVPNFKFIEIDNMVEDEYSESQTIRLFDAVKIAEGVVTELNKYEFNRKKTIVCIEGFSYASNSSRLAEMSGYQYLLRYFLHINGYVFDIASPKTIKKFAGNGNFKIMHTFNKIFPNYLKLQRI